ncbi:hypothetical protein M441DRAFT_31214 [Trichoderma asperellum CBS 433.97]|uniref:ATP-dependent DNA helicase n=1 Tax=Trichoderma asperellum (strain ATCC 204424 / CBS 433.97 / NBRC 101777) TaxID=1042311 RepID=A0A2T3YVP3_TRIA4|nr:hypothetical protein M441DRAFT_31214 [Trichoderma asperellum CBS 433.97]PTB36641.1 hypothetical protein M441DRAFT_31214 [Trichoderma asperellum CBS 433.97]
MLFARLWRRSVASAISSSGLGRQSLQQPFPTPVMFIPKLHRNRKECPGIGEKEKDKLTAADPEQASSSKTPVALNITSKRPNDDELAPVKTRSRNLTKGQSPILSVEQENLVSLAVEGHNIFYTGPAGCGKSTVLRVIRDRLEGMGNNVLVLTPTDDIALANGGRNTWSFASCMSNSHTMSLSQITNPERNPQLFERMANVEVIIISEINMVENFHFERLNEVMKAVKSSSLPFGGIQVIVTGDFCGLPPVMPFQNCFHCGSYLKHNKQKGTYTCLNEDCNINLYYEEDKWAFQSRSWQQCNFHNVHLAAVFRQEDPALVSLLREIRLNLKVSDDSMGLLRKRKNKTSNHAVKLLTTRADVRELNDAKFLRLRAPLQVYQSVDVYGWNEGEHEYLAYNQERDTRGSFGVLRDYNLGAKVQLKEGMPVVLLQNIDPGSGLCNGAQGIIIGYEPFGNLLQLVTEYYEHLPAHWLRIDALEDALRRFLRECSSNKGWPIVKFHNGITRTIYPTCRALPLGGTQPYSLLGRIQVPLTAGWALTVYDAQGMALDSIVVDVVKTSREGLMYAALSRARTWQGLKVEGDLTRLGYHRGNGAQLKWLKRTFGHKVVMAR